ncbi:hypothetical protein MTO96_034785 [Rhipicephalus appendiculatus]
MLYVSDCRRLERRFMLGSPGNLDNAQKLSDKVFAAWPDCPEEVRCHPCLLRALRQLLKNPQVLQVRQTSHGVLPVATPWRGQ